MRAARSLRTTTLVALIAASLVSIGSIGLRPASATTAVQARMADDFVDSIGVATHLSYGGTPNAASAGIKNRLAELGVRHLRDGWGPGSQHVDAFATDLANTLGIKITMVWDPRGGSDLPTRIAALKARQLPFTETIEGANEWDVVRYSMNGWTVTADNWAAQLRDWSTRVVNAVNGDPVTARIPLAAPALAKTMSATPYHQVGPISGLDYGTTHDYPGNTYMMTENIARTAQANARIIAGAGKPVIATETGFTTNVGATDGGYAPTPESVASVQGVRLYFEHFRTGITRSFSYNLVDKGTTNTFENGFGLLKADLTPKPEFNAIKNMIDILEDPGAKFTPGALDFSLTGANDATRSVLLQKRDGTFYLAVWQETSTWNGSSLLNPPDVNMTLDLGTPAVVNTYDPTRSAAPIATTATASVPFTSSEELRLFEIGGGSVVPVTRINGPDRIATSVAASRHAFPDNHTADNVILAGARSYADALAGAPLAANKNAPLMLNRDDEVDPRVLGEIQRVMKPGGTVYLVGGKSALGSPVVWALRKAGLLVERIAGTDRYTTAAAIAEHMPDPQAIFLVTGKSFADALAAAPAAIATHGVVLLTAGSEQHEATAQFLALHPDVPRYTIGGPAAGAVSDATSFSGVDRYATAALIADTFFPDPARVAAASGRSYADAITAATASRGAPMLLVTPDARAWHALDYVTRHNDTVESLEVFGGARAVDDAVVSWLAIATS
jgi:putative cell wall-binding protein